MLTLMQNTLQGYTLNGFMLDAFFLTTLKLMDFIFVLVNEPILLTYLI